jgi:hypothetical protein
MISFLKIKKREVERLAAVLATDPLLFAASVPALRSIETSMKSKTYGYPDRSKSSELGKLQRFIIAGVANCITLVDTWA